MTTFDENIKFKGQWRPYQKRVLDDLQKYITDEKLHVVAAPGSGKTILGLQVLITLDSPALVLTPTITIREQWIERFNNHFVPDGFDTSNIISSDIKKPKTITVMTYQGLHSAYKGKDVKEESSEEEIEQEDSEQIEIIEKIDIVSVLKDLNVKTIVMDEAHHLRTEWWNSLNKIIASLENIKLVSLTATPPYDVSEGEWEKYKSLCGPIDAEIFVPELVLDNNLCPHQDYIYFNYPTEDELNIIKSFKENVKMFEKEIYSNEEFKTAIKNHPGFINIDTYEEKFLDNPEYYSSLLVFLKYINTQVPLRLTQILGHNSKIPDMSLHWLEVLLQGVLFEDFESFTQYEDLMKNIKKRLNELGCIEKKKVMLSSNSGVNKLLVSSVGKLNSIKDIVRYEYSNLREKLKLVILTDFIRKECLPKDKDNIPTLNSIGVIPIFESIRRENHSALLGVLSGTIVIIPAVSRDKTIEIANAHGINENDISFKTLDCDSNYLLIDVTTKDKKKIVNVITKLFSVGGINVLVGTKSLLGEGWDEPSINTLILASFVGSYMLSNQMRGRAIRVNREDPNKTANIWHLVCIEKPDQPLSNNENIQKQLMGYDVLVSQDYEMLVRRFKSFVGLHYSEDIIENGISRIDIIKPPYNAEGISNINARMLDLSAHRGNLYSRWFEVLNKFGKNAMLIEETKANKEKLPYNFTYMDKPLYLLINAALCALGVLPYILSGFFATQFRGISIIYLLMVIPSLLKGSYLYLKYGSVTKSLKQVGEVLLDALKKERIIKTENVYIQTEKLTNFASSCYLKGGTSYEKNVFNNCLEELLAPIDNPRYLIEWTAKGFGVSRTNYYQVPSTLSRNKESAQFFSVLWKNRIGENNLVYTRNADGRKILIKARTNSLSYESLEKTERKLVWKSKWA